MDRTVKIQLQPTPEQAQALRETLEQFTCAFNAVIVYGWEHQEKNGVKLHHATYRDTQIACPGLVSDLLIQARVKATETVKSALTWQAKNLADYPKRVEKAKKKDKPIPKFKPVKCPQSKLCPVRYNVHTYTFNWEKQEVRLSTTSGRMSIPFRIPSYSAKYYGCPVATADLCYRHGKFWLHVVISVPEPTIPRNPEVIGVDLGLNRPAVTSNRHFLGSRHWKEVDRRRFRLKRKLQSKGTKSAKRHLKKLSGKALRFHRDCDHVLTKRIVQSVPPGSTIVLENLTHIRDTSKMGRGKQNKNVDNKRKLHSWTFAQFHSFLAYKAQECGIAVVKVDPRHTSQTCSRCGYQHRSNRRSQSLFLCRQCGYCLNADLNASYNIREKYLTSLAQDGISVLSASSSTGVSSQPLGG
jgi:IS605 OrfB family transposase